MRNARLNYDLHRAGGLWPWLLLAMMALSGVYLTLYNELFMPLLRTVATVAGCRHRDQRVAFTELAGSHGVFVDDRSGAVTYLRAPRGTAAAVFVNWLGALHMGTVFGTPTRLFCFCWGSWSRGCR